MIQRYYTLPSLPSMPLEQIGEDSWWSVLVPLARTNLITNPSFETGTTGWSGSSASISRVATEQAHGAYSLQVTSSSAPAQGGATSPTVSMTAGSIYACSIKLKGKAGVRYALDLYQSGLVRRESITANGRWQWLTFVAAALTTANGYLYAHPIDDSVDPFYVDGAQIESCADGILAATTYIDGDQLGLVPNQFPPAYGWNGTPHASTSYRTGQTRAGGYAMKFSQYNFLLVAMIGLGLLPGQAQATPFAQLDGAEYQRTVIGPRQFTLVGRFSGAAPRVLEDLRGALAANIGRDTIGTDQAVVLRYERTRCVGGSSEAASLAAQIPAVYAGGFSGNSDNLVGETAPITFTTYVPQIRAEIEAGAALGVQSSLSSAGFIVKRSPSGVWSTLGTGVNLAGIEAMIAHPNGKVYVGGSFTDAGGSGAQKFAQYDPATNTWSVIGSATAINNTVWGMALGPDGTIYLVGDFTNANGIAAADYIVAYNPATSSYSALGTGANGTIFAVAVAPDGTVYAGGLGSSDLGGVAATNGIGKWDGTAWSALGTGLATGTDAVGAIEVVGSRVYAGGGFTGIGGSGGNNLAVWNGSSWAALAGGNPNAAVAELTRGTDGRIYIGGSFTTLGSVAASYIGATDGSQYFAVGGSSALNDLVWGIASLSDALYVGGQFTAINGVAIPRSGLARWNGGAFVPADIAFTVTPVVSRIERGPDGSLYVALRSGGTTSTAAAVTTVTNPGTAKAYPTLTIKGPSSGTSRIYQIVNMTTGKAVYLNYTINAGETARFVFDPQRLSFTSDFQGNLASKILPGSTEAEMFLQPGANDLSFFAASSSVTAFLSWLPAYQSIDDLTF